MLADLHPQRVHPQRVDRWRPAVRCVLGMLGMLLVLIAGACGSGDGTGEGGGDGEGAGDGPSAAAPGGPVEVYVRWELDRDFPAEITIHEPPPGQELYEVRTYAAGETAAVGAAIPGGLLHVAYSEPRRFIARLHNRSPEAVRFWVAPHLPVPHVSEQGLMMFCLCTGEVYEVPAGGTWTRVMEFGVTRRAGLTGPLTLVHVLVRGELPGPGSVATRAGAGAP